MGQKSLILAVGLIIFTIILAVLFVFSRGQTTPKTSKVTTTTQQNQLTNLVSLNDVVNSPLVYTGYTIDIKSQITDWVTNKSFLFYTPAGGAFGGTPSKQLLIIAKEPFTLPQDPNDNKVGLGELTKVIAHGQIQIYSRDQLQTALGVNLSGPEIALDNNNIENWKYGPVLLLDKVEIDNSIGK